jgi:hypothetical protein
MPILKGNYSDGFLLSSQRVALKIAMKGKNTDSGLWLYGTPANGQVAGGADGAELAQGVLKVEFYRGPGQQFLTADASNADYDWGGAYDVAARINAGNYAANTTSYGGIQALRVYCRQYSGGSIANMLGAEISVDERGSGNPSCANIVGCLITMRVNNVVSGNANVLVVEDNTQGSLTAATATAQAMLKIRSVQAIATGIRKTCIHFETSGSGSGWTHALSFQTDDGLEGFTSIANKALSGTVYGSIKVYDVANNKTLYINCYDAVANS